jgi:ATP-dependent DNA helicase RecQ
VESIELTELLQEKFGFSTFRVGQEQVVRALLEGRSSVAVFPTGSGKSLCYQLTALCLDGVTVVVSPLIALMKDQIDFLQARGIAAARLDSSIGLDALHKINDDLANGTLKMLYVAPERFNNERFLGQMANTKIAMMAIDEAHCISEWGHNFRPDYLKLAEQAKNLGVERVLALTATATPSVVKDIQTAFGITDTDAVITGFYRENLTIITTPVTIKQRDGVLLERLKSRPPGPTIVYVTLQKTAERVAGLLADAGFPAEPYHAGMQDEERGAVQDRWMASDGGIVVATIAFGMGIDKSNVRYVYHYNLPKSLESYSQEIGRAGRDNETSICEMLCCPNDIPTLENFTYGDIPTYESLLGLMTDLLTREVDDISGEAVFDVSLYELSDTHDIRQLVLKTILTYLELQGVLRQGTPFYAAYEFKLLGGNNPASIAKTFPPPYDDFAKSLFQAASFGKIWYKINPDPVAQTLEVERRRVVKALEVMEEKGFIEMRVAEARLRFYKLQNADPEVLASELAARFSLREKNEIERLHKVLKLVTMARCQTNVLTGYFGDKRAQPCGHCTFCQTGAAQVLPPLVPPNPIPTDLVKTLRGLREINQRALGTPRQLARFACGLTSPAAVRARLSRHPLYGVLETHPFAEVLEWVEQI